MENFNKDPWSKKSWQNRRLEIIEKRNKCELCGKTQEDAIEKYKCGLVIHHKWAKNKAHSEDEYIEYKNLNDDDISVLCKKCHFMTHKGYDSICPECGGHKKTKYEKCYKCSVGWYEPFKPTEKTYYLAYCGTCYRIFAAQFWVDSRIKECTHNDCVKYVNDKDNLASLFLEGVGKFY